MKTIYIKANKEIQITAKTEEKWKRYYLCVAVKRKKFIKYSWTWQDVSDHLFVCISRRRKQQAPPAQWSRMFVCRQERKADIVAPEAWQKRQWSYRCVCVVMETKKAVKHPFKWHSNDTCLSIVRKIRKEAKHPFPLLSPPPHTHLAQWSCTLNFVFHHRKPVGTLCLSVARKKKKRAKRPLDMARLESVQKFLSLPPNKITRHNSLHNIKRAVERELRVPQ